MNKGTVKGFFVGILTCVVACSLMVTVFAANRTISVSDGIRVIINGALFAPKDAQGNAVELFSYNGTTYAPVRAICEAAGLKVGYDNDRKAAVITTADRAWAEEPSSSRYITADAAKKIALDDAGVAAADVVFLKVRLDWDDAEYEVEFYRGNTEYDYDIDAVSGRIKSVDRDAEDFDLGGSTAATAEQGNLISGQRAQEIALARAPSGTTVVSCELDRDDGRYVYEIKMRNGRMEYECDINAVTGAILDWDVDDD